MLATLVLIFVALAQVPPADALKDWPDRWRDQILLSNGLSIGSNRSVHRELGATDEQARTLGALTALARDRFLADMHAPDDPRPGAEAARLEGRMSRAASEFRDALDQVLRPEQVRRYEQLAVRAAGVAALSVPRVRAALRPTDEQVARIRALEEEIDAAWLEAMGEVIEIEGGRRMDLSRVVDLSRRLVIEFEASLEPKQRAAWEALAGDPFELEEEPVVEPR